MLDAFTDQFKGAIFEYSIDNPINHSVRLGVNRLIRTRALTGGTSFTSKDEPHRRHYWDHRTGRLVSR